MRSALRSCLLYSWIRLMWQSNIVSGSTLKPNFPLIHCAQSLLLSRFTCMNLSRKCRVVGERLQPRQLIKIGDPCAADGVGNQFGERRIRRAKASGAALRRWSCC